MNAIIHKARTVVGFTLMGMVTAGALFGWLPAFGVISIHEIGAAVGALIGVTASARNVI